MPLSSVKGSKRHAHSPNLEHLTDNTEEMIRESGFDVEIHKVQTSDGYIIPLHRILNPRSGPQRNETPVLMMHGLFSCSGVYLTRNREDSLGQILADNGYDVWLGNMRGSKYSREHILFSTSDPEFWDFTLDDVSTKDLTAQIDYILGVTQRKKLNYVGISMGFSILNIMLAQLPEYNEKMNLVAGLAPVVYANEVESSNLKFVVHKLSPFIRKRYGEGEFLPNLDRILWKVCDDRLLTYYLCTSLYNEGRPHDEYDTKKLKYYLANTFTSTSLKLLEHGRQIMLLSSPASFDDPANNRTAVTYNADNVRIHTLLIYSEGDNIATIANIIKMNSTNPNSSTYKVPKSEFNHLDFMFGNNANDLVYKEVLRYFETADKDVSQYIPEPRRSN